MIRKIFFATLALATAAGGMGLGESLSIPGVHGVGFAGIRNRWTPAHAGQCCRRGPPYSSPLRGRRLLLLNQQVQDPPEN